MKDDRPGNTQNNRATGPSNVESLKPDARRRPKKPSKPPHIVDVTAMFETLGEVQKEWPLGIPPSTTSHSQELSTSDSISPRKNPSGVGASGMSGSLSRKSSDRTPDERPTVPQKPKGKSPEM